MFAYIVVQKYQVVWSLWSIYCNYLFVIKFLEYTLWIITILNQNQLKIARSDLIWYEISATTFGALPISVLISSKPPEVNYHSC